MLVRIPKGMLDNDHALLRLLGLTDRDLSYRTHFEIDLSSLDAKTLKQVRESASESTYRGAKSLLRDIDTWTEACASVKGAKGARARSTSRAHGLLIEYLKHSKRKHLYKRVQQGADGVTLAYYIEELIFHPKETRREYTTPEHITVDLIYEAFGQRKSERWTIWPEACLGMTPPEIIHHAGFMRESDSLRDDYEYYLDHYSDWYGKIGKQFLAVGLADTSGIDGNDDDDDDVWWRRTKNTKLLLDKDGVPSRVVIDVFREDDKGDKREDDCRFSTVFWKHRLKRKSGVKEDELEEDDDAEETIDDTDDKIEIPVHPYVVVFDLVRHLRLKMHVGNLTEYKYDKSIRERLVLPEKNARLIDTLLVAKDAKFSDIVKGKSGGTIILCQGKPGTGKTLTAEVYAEAMERALYTVQCSQLGTNPEKLEENLLKTLARGRRWGAVMLLDEADVYVHERGSDLTQNAIVGVFLRVLEYQSGVLFMTTNRGDLVDDAILSRCTARVPYRNPKPEDQRKIWASLSEQNGIELTPNTIKKIVEQHPKLSGRDIKNLLKLAALVAHDRESVIDAELITEVKVFKPTTDEEDEKLNERSK